MLAGTVQTELSIQHVQKILAEHDIDTQFVDDELVLNGEATLIFRDGFDHEFIVVGDAPAQSILQQATRRLCEVLAQHQLAHEVEIYDTGNHLVFTHSYMP